MSQVKKEKTATEGQVHLLGHALNILCKKGIIDLNSLNKIDQGHLECTLFNKPSIILWRDVEHGEIRLSVWWNYDKSNHPQHLEGGYKNKIVIDSLTDDELWDLRKKTPKKQQISIKYTEQYQTNLPLANKRKYKDFVGVTCSCRVERATGKHLMLSTKYGLEDSYIRETDKQALRSIPDCVPNGFKLYGMVF